MTEDMVGHKLGEFSPTRTFRGHTNKKEGIKDRALRPGRSCGRLSREDSTATS